MCVCACVRVCVCACARACVRACVCVCVCVGASSEVSSDIPFYYVLLLLSPRLRSVMRLGSHGLSLLDVSLRVSAEFGRGHGDNGMSITYVCC